MDPPESPDYFGSLDDLPDESLLATLSPLKLGPQRVPRESRAASQPENRPDVSDNIPDIISSDHSQPPQDAVSSTNFVKLKQITGYYSALNTHEQGPSISTGHPDNAVFPSVTFVQEPRGPGHPRKLVDPSIPTAPKDPVGWPPTTSRTDSCTS
ncbi:hypothetical protein C8J57DRAFT_1256799 [Mycena rebaudengoi]|nr:hypothetical protein C8J57DRAFT_1256799 [Mycena rebaudengoi]